MSERTKIRVKQKKHRKRAKSNPTIFGIRKKSLVLGTIFTVLLLVLLCLAFIG